MTSYLIGIDYGTGGAKACIIDQEANILGYAYREFTLKTNKLGWSEHDPKCYWPFTCGMIKECLNESGINPKEIRGIGTSSAMPSLVMVDSNHQPINMAYNLMDRRAKKEIGYLKNNIGEDKIFDITGNRLDDHPVIVNLLWEKNNRLNSYEKIYKALSIDGYIRLKLTGKASLNYSVAALYGVAYDIRKNTFTWVST
jgi:ribulokinase